MIPFIYRISKHNKLVNKTKKSRLTENKLVVTSGERREGETIQERGV